jgi:exodeoxyribonuclease VII small subunit
MLAPALCQSPPGRGRAGVALPPHARLATMARPRAFTRPEVPTDEAQTADFEQMLKELETLVSRLEQGELSLDESLRQFERGVELSRRCESALRAAEQKVEILLEQGADARPVPFDPPAG